MKRVVLTFGTIAGLITAAMFFISMPLLKSGVLNFDNGEIVGYATMIIALSLIFFGVRSFRDNNHAGVISFGKAFQVGILIAGLASFIYALGWEAYLAIDADPDNFMSEYTAHYIEQMQKDGASQAEMDEMRTEMASMSEMYRNPLVRFGITLMEILPVGLAITIISALILRRARVPQAG